MQTETVAVVLEREHQEIDIAIEAFVAGCRDGSPQQQPLIRAIESLRRHIYAEEELLFPALREAGLIGPILVMLREHGHIWRTLDDLQRHLPDPDGKADVLKLCRELSVRLLHHNRKEEHRP